jgi:hypothetical protein
MSYTETHIGRLKRVDIEEDIEEWFKKYCESNGIHKLSGFNQCWEEEFFHHFGDEFFMSYGYLYQKFNDMELDWFGGFIRSDINFIHKEEDGTYTFFMRFYNGGTYLDEQLELGMIDLNYP